MILFLDASLHEPDPADRPQEMLGREREPERKYLIKLFCCQSIYCPIFLAFLKRKAILTFFSEMFMLTFSTLFFHASSVSLTLL